MNINYITRGFKESMKQTCVKNVWHKVWYWVEIGGKKYETFDYAMGNSQIHSIVYNHKNDVIGVSLWEI